MKRYNIFPIKKKFEWGEMLVVPLGESGRGRKNVLIPYHAKEDEEFLELGTTKRGNPKIIAGADGGDSWLAVVSAAGCYTKHTYGTVRVPKDQKERVKVVSHGWGAYGAAGRVGGWDEFLLVVKDNTWLQVKPSGGYKIPAYWLYFGENEVFKLEEEELDAFLEAHDLEAPGDLTKVDN